jgi:hypothetical protein
MIMFCDQLTSRIGLQCHSLDDNGNVFMIETPFRFQDGDHIPVYVEVKGNHYRFFDDGATFMHFAGLGVNLSGGNQIKFLKNAAETHGACFTDQGEIEIWAESKNSGNAFAAYVATLLELVRWEGERRATSHDTGVFVEEVAQYLMAWKRTEIKRNPKITGITGREYVLDFDMDGTLVLAISAHHQSSSSALHKLIDIKGLPANGEVQTLVVIDDRKDPDAAKAEGLLLSSVSKVIGMGQLRINAGTPNTLM